MAKVTVSRQFRDDFETWANDRLHFGAFTKEDMEEMRAMIRTDLTPGPDQLRDGLKVITAAGVEVPAMIDNVEDRIKCWTDYFAACAHEIRNRQRMAA